jgi:hypothetical protein
MTAKIYESPDGGWTVYEREVGNKTRTLINDDRNSLQSQLKEDQLWSQIRRLARTNPGLQSELERVIIYYNLIKDNGN